MAKKSFLILALVVILGAVLRFAFLTYNPPSFNWDEVSHGYNAYSILKTGMDEWGQKLPIANFRAYGDYPLPLNLYLTIPFIAIFGLTEFALRFPHALLGVLTIISVFFLTDSLTKRRTVSLLAAFLTAISPWTLFTSRFVLQSNLSVFLLITALALFFNRQKNKYFLPLSLVLLGLSLFAYHTTRIFSPIILVVLLFIYRKEKILSWLNITIILLFFVPLPFILLNKGARARSSVVFLLDEGAVNKIIELRNFSKLPKVVARLVYNRPTYFIYNFGKNYLGYFSPKYLFFKGGTQYQFSVPDQGLVSWINLPFFYIGLAWLVVQSFKGKKKFQLVLVWFLLAPIPAAVTNESFAVLRSSTMLPLPFILSAIGLVEVLNLLFAKGSSAKKWLIALYVLSSLVMLGRYLKVYFGDYRNNYSWAWQYGYQEAVDYAKQNYNQYDKIIVTKKYGEPHEFFLFFMKWDPAKYRDDSNLIRFYQSNWYWVDRFDKFYFVNDWQVKDLITESKVKIDCKSMKCLLVTSPDNYPSGWKKLETINFLDGKSAFEIYEN
jgi:4-amino-4-deoxy-L-arabinose transferase-like glycosyltransferase